MKYKTFIRPLLFLLAPETAHKLSIKLLPLLKYFLCNHQTDGATQIAGIHFPNRIGIAAGYDKNAETIAHIQNLGVGFIEVGTLTPKAQTGNPKPRLFRLVKSNALINRMGLNNIGIEAAIKKISQTKAAIPIGISIGKNNDTAYENALDDYVFGVEKAYDYCDYIAVNISCPNVSNPAAFWTGSAFANLLTAIKQKQLQLQHDKNKYRPIFIKVSPDLTEQEIKSCAELINDSGLDGIIATNTSASLRPNTNDKAVAEKGGLSGAPLFDLSLQTVQYFRQYLKPEVVIIGVGGIDSAERAQQFFAAGADLIQVYTGLVYEGPKLISRIKAVRVYLKS